MTLLETMAMEECESFTRGTCADEDTGRRPDAEYLAEQYCPPCRLRAALAESKRTSDEWESTLRYAATALEGSGDNGDRYCAAQIRAALVERDTTMEPETETENDLRIRALGNLLFGEEKVQAEMDRLSGRTPKRTFPPSYAMDRQQALHELWVAATNPDTVMSHEEFTEAIELVEKGSLVSISNEKIKAVAHAISYNVNETEDVDWPLASSAEAVVREVLRLVVDDDAG